MQPGLVQASHMITVKVPKHNEQPVLFQPWSFGGQARNQVLTGLLPSWLHLLSAFLTSCSGKWKTVASSRALFLVGALLLCLFVVIKDLFIWEVGAIIEPIGFVLCKQRELQQPLRPPSPSCWAAMELSPWSAFSKGRLLQGPGGTHKTWTYLLAWQAWSAVGFLTLVMHFPAGLFPHTEPLP